MKELEIQEQITELCKIHADKIASDPPQILIKNPLTSAWSEEIVEEGGGKIKEKYQ